MKETQAVPHADTLDRLNSGPVTFSGDRDALYERHLTFDHVVPIAAATPRVKFGRRAFGPRTPGTSGTPGRAPLNEETHHERGTSWLGSQFMVSVASAGR